MRRQLAAPPVPPRTALQRHVTVTIPTPSGPVPDLAATERMAGVAVTRRAARRAECAAFDRKPTSVKPATRLAKRDGA
jgi:hypothetical protein